MQIVRLETKNGRVFKIAINNENQKKRLQKVINDNKNKSYEVFVKVEYIEEGVQDIKQLENINKYLVWQINKTMIR